MREKSCCFTGHRQIPKEYLERIKEQTKTEIKKLIEQGATNFLNGGAVGYDLLVGQIIIELKQSYPQINLTLVLPCKDQCKFWSETDKQAYKQLLLSANRIIYTSEQYHNGCMHTRNRYMVDNCNFVIAYCTKQSGGSYYTMDYAKNQNVSVLMLKL